MALNNTEWMLLPLCLGGQKWKGKMKIGKVHAKGKTTKENANTPYQKQELQEMRSLTKISVGRK